MRVRPLLAGEILLARDFFTPRPGALGPYRAMLSQLRRRDAVWAPVPVFLLEHPTEGPVLVDTGYAQETARGVSVARTMGRASAILFQHRPGDLDALLAEAGVQASDVRTVVMTHLHTDHAAGAERFPQATFVADRREWRAGDKGGNGLSSGGYVTSIVRAIARRREIDFDGPQATALGAFPKTVDLFGDGSLVLLSTPGHTPGHQSLLVRLGSGRELLLTADAADLRSMVGAPERTSVMSDEREFLQSLATIGDYARANPQTIVIPGHDAEVWPTLDAVYD